LKKVVSLQTDLRINPLEGKEIMMNVVADGSKAWTEWSSIWTKESKPWTQHEKACHSLHTDATKQLAGIQPLVA
jgi:hypothetical protein